MLLFFVVRLFLSFYVCVVVFYCKKLNDVEVFCSPCFWQFNEKVCVYEDMQATNIKTRYGAII